MNEDASPFQGESWKGRWGEGEAAHAPAAEALPGTAQAATAFMTGELLHADQDRAAHAEAAVSRIAQILGTLEESASEELAVALLTSAKLSKNYSEEALAILTAEARKTLEEFEKRLRRPQQETVGPAKAAAAEVLRNLHEAELAAMHGRGEKPLLQIKKDEDPAHPAVSVTCSLAEEFEIADEALVPDTLQSPDMRKIREHVKAGNPLPPGVRAVRKFRTLVPARSGLPGKAK